MEFAMVAVAVAGMSVFAWYGASILVSWVQDEIEINRLKNDIKRYERGLVNG